MPAAGQITADARAEAPRGARLGGGERADDAGETRRRGMSPARSPCSPRARTTALDIAASGLTYFAVREADKPADEDHPFGHAKIEAVAALVADRLSCSCSPRRSLSRRCAGSAAKRRSSTPTSSPSPRSSSRSSSTSCAGARLTARRRAHRQRRARRRRAALLQRPRRLGAGAGRPRGDPRRPAARRRAGRGRRRAVHRRRRLPARPPHRSTRWSTRRRRGWRERCGARSSRCPASPESTSSACGAAGAEVVGELGLLVSRTLPLERVAAIKADVEAAIRSPALAECRADDHRQSAGARRRDPARAHSADRRPPAPVRPPRRRPARRRAQDASRSTSKSTARMRLADAHEIASQLEEAIAADLGARHRGRDPYRADGDRANSAGEPADPALTERIAAALRASRGARRRAERYPRRAGARAARGLLRHLPLPRRRRASPSRRRMSEVDALERALRDRISRSHPHRRPRRAGALKRRSVTARRLRRRAKRLCSKDNEAA